MLSLRFRHFASAFVNTEDKLRFHHHYTEFICPITGEIFQDPVVAADGNTYERLHIENWLRTHHTSPVTSQPLPHKHLVPNLAIRKMIHDSDSLAPRSLF